MLHLWAGIEAGKAHHHCVVIDADGNRLLSQKVPNDEPAFLDLIAAVMKLAGGGEVVWATDLNHGGLALLIAMRVAHGQDILYIPGRIVHRASKLYRGEDKTDAQDAAVIADQARMRRDLRPLRTVVCWDFDAPTAAWAAAAEKRAFSQACLILTIRSAPEGGEVVSPGLILPTLQSDHCYWQR